ncbi:BTAD domain-containing putative transcriptional regulator [Streptomyces sp. NPDC018693]|uniref:AfsR/SARP family transcriptional regulator n=1 Tax=unclassified Streptomyces TaxID=2593676 RepID=UPI0037A4100B
MWVQLLGPVRAWRQNVEVVLGPPKQRAVLGLLAGRANDVVRIEEIIDAVWDGDVPRSAVNGVHTYVAGLRRVLDPQRGNRDRGGILVSSGGGYSLRLDPEDIDAHRFDRFHGQARRLRAAGDVRGALALLDAALALWHGEAYASVPGSFAFLERARLHELRLTVTEEWAGDLLTLGRHTEAAPVLTDLVAREPLREKLRWLLMLTFYRSGRRADALRFYRETRVLLRDELGVEPGTELRTLHEQMLADQMDLTAVPGPVDEPDGVLRPSPHRTPPPAPELRPPVRAAQRPAADLWPSVRPAQLPPLDRGFTGRSMEMTQLRRLMTEGGDRSQDRTTMAVICGAPGVGKSALALRAAHTTAEHYPDGQLFVDLCGTSADREPLTAMEALGQVLTSLGAEEPQLPTDLPGRTALYRSLLYGRRVLLVLDDAFDAEQLRPLVPQGPACVLVTSRWRQSGLVARDGAHCVELAPLVPEESVNLLTYLAPGRTADSQDAVAHLARLCGHLPLALRVTAEVLAAHPSMSARELAEAVSDCRMERLDVVRDAAASLRSVFARSYRALPAEVARMFRMLGLYDGPVITVEIAARLSGSNAVRARRQLEALAEAHLLMKDDGGSYRFQELIGLYAADCAEEEPAPSRTAALARALALQGDNRYCPRYLSGHQDSYGVQDPYRQSPLTAGDLR